MTFMWITEKELWIMYRTSWVYHYCKSWTAGNR